MRLGDFLDRCIEPFAPGLAARRMTQRVGLASIRQYDAAAHDRRTSGWKRPSSGANRENAQSIVALRNGARELVRNNKYAAAARKQMVAQMIGDGITARAVHADTRIQELAQAAWDGWSASKVYENRHDFFHVQRLLAGTMVESGEGLQLWLPDGDIPDTKIRVLEGDYLDLQRNQNTATGRIVQGVEYARNNDRVAYYLFGEHPGDGIFGSGSLASQPVPAEVVDHIYDESRPGQVRGISWFAATALTIRDAAEIEDARRLKEKVAACVSLVLTPGEQANAASPLGETKDNGADKQDTETLRPGMIFRTKPGETVSSLNPAAPSDTVAFIRQQLGAVSASLVPYHLMTGDVSQANYSSLRAAMLGFWALLDDWQQQIVIPLCCQPAFERRMRLLAIQSGDKRFLQVKPQWAVPNRGFVDPVKDLMGEILAIRAGLKTMTAALSQRGIDIDKHLTEIKRVDDLIDKLSLALDTDPRRVTLNGILQATAPYLFKGDGTEQTNN